MSRASPALCPHTGSSCRCPGAPDKTLPCLDTPHLTCRRPAHCVQKRPRVWPALSPFPQPSLPVCCRSPRIGLAAGPHPHRQCPPHPGCQRPFLGLPPRIPSRPCSSLSWPPLSLVPMLLPTPRACPHVLWALSSGLLLSSPAGLGSLATDLQPARPHVSSCLQASQCCGHCRGLGTSRGPFPPRLLGRQGQGACGCANHSVVPDHGGRLLNVNEGKRGHTEVPAAEGHTRGSREG